MFDLLQHISEIPIAAAFGTLGLTAQLVWPLFRKREALLSIQLAATCSYATSYALMGQETATAVCLTGAIQTTVALLAGDRKWLPKLAYVFLPVVLGLGAMTYAGIQTVFAVMACCLMMLGRMQSDTLSMRRIQLCASPFGATHDVIVGAWPCLAGACFSFAIALTGFLRERRERGAVALPA